MNASSRKEIREAEKTAKLREEARRNFLCGAMSIPQGRAFFYDLLETCHLFSDPFTGVALTEAYLKGERNIGLKLFAEILQWAPDDYIVMTKEANHARSSTATELAGRSDPDGGTEGTGDLFDDPEPGAE